MDVPSTDELDALATPGPKLADGPAGMPDPEPEIVRRAQELLQGAPPAQEVELTEDQKLRLLAHVLEGQPYEDVYRLYGGRMVVAFVTLDAVTARQIGERLIQDEQRAHRPVPKATRGVRYAELEMRASIRQLVIDDQPLDLQLYDPLDVETNPLTAVQHKLLYQQFLLFKSGLDLLIKKADDPSFWPTPS